MLFNDGGMQCLFITLNVIFYHRLGEYYHNMAKLHTKWISIARLKLVQVINIWLREYHVNMCLLL